MKQNTVWKKEEKCLNLQKKFGNYDDFEENKTKNPIIANRQCVYFTVKDILKGNNYTLLEVGPGPGHFLWALKDYAKEVHGLEYSPEMISLCKKQFKKNKRKVFLKQGTCVDLPYDDNLFDVSLQCDVTRHVGGCWESLCEQIRVSRKFVVFSGPSFENWDVDEPFERELSKLLFGINVNRFNFELDRMKGNNVIKNYYYKDRPNKKDIIKRKILVIEVNDV
jgi:ubiquinone/menaquinone biosynthesis C-methylase UbiE